MDKKIDKILKMTDEELKQSFIAYFGQEKWDEEEALGKLVEYQMVLANYLGVDPIPILVEEMMEDSRLYIKEEYIAISKECIKNHIEALKAVSHEYRHYYQLQCIRKGIDTQLVNNWKEDFLNPVQVTDPDDALSMTLYGLMTIEVDAFAFQKFALKKFLDIETHHASLEYDMILDSYINKYFK